MGVPKIMSNVSVYLFVFMLSQAFAASHVPRLTQHGLHGATRRQFNFLHNFPHNIFHPVPVIPRKQAYHTSNRLPTKLNNFEHFNANNRRQLRLHQQIRRREGTEIFEGRKPDVIHYIEPPQIVNKKQYSSLIDERTPAATKIVSENKYVIPDTLTGFIKPSLPQ